ncbi:MAG: PIN domain-containing protein [Candidatus Binatia bacterium]
MSDKIFVDTNVLIYAHDLDAGDKHAIAVGVLKELWASRLGVLSIQVLQEFYVNVTRKIPSPLSPSMARNIMKNYTAWQIETLEPAHILLASE